MTTTTAPSGWSSSPSVAPGSHRLEVGPITDDIRAAIAVQHGVTVRDVLLTRGRCHPPYVQAARSAVGPTAPAYLDGTLRSVEDRQRVPRRDGLIETSPNDTTPTSARLMQGDLNMDETQSNSNLPEAPSPPGHRRRART